MRHNDGTEPFEKLIKSARCNDLDTIDFNEEEETNSLVNWMSFSCAWNNDEIKREIVAREKKVYTEWSKLQNPNDEKFI